jgi:hypothetical protein
MKKLIILLLLSSSITAFAQKANFSGNWLINKSKVDFGEAPEWILPRSFKIVQTADRLFISRILLKGDLTEQAPINDTLSFDGSAFKNPLEAVSIHWLNDQSFTLNRKSNSEVNETWTLEDGGKTLVINRDVKQSNGMQYQIKSVYDKQ